MQALARQTDASRYVKYWSEGLAEECDNISWSAWEHVSGTGKPNCSYSNIAPGNFTYIPDSTEPHLKSAQENE